MTKVCSKCGVEKDVDCFSKCRKYKDGLACQCKNCGKEYRLLNKNVLSKKAKLYYLDNKDLIKENAKNYRENNIEEISRKKKIYRENNKDEQKIRQHNWYINNKEYVLDKQKKNRLQHRDRYIELSKLYRENNNEKFIAYRKENKDNINSYGKKRTLLCPDSYVKNLIILQFGDMEHIPESLIDLKRSELKLKRAIKHVRG